jgi:cytochrome c biogenesis protein CcmG, thiol:disulfide interchange protein DsbE
MNSRLVYITPLVLAVGLGLILYTALGKDPNKLETARLNDPIPPFELSVLEDQGVKVSQDALKGTATLLNVWATWCPSCRTEHPYLLSLANQGVPIVGLNYKDDRAKAKQWLSELGDPYSLNIYDPKGSFGFDLGVYGAPETYLVDKDGIVRYRHVGEVNKRIWEAQIEPRYRELLGR